LSSLPMAVLVSREETRRDRGASSDAADRRQAGSTEAVLKPTEAAPVERTLTS
jgi:hypothetical protein